MPDDGAGIDLHRTFRATTRPRIVCLCGSSRFADEFHLAAYALTTAGEIVLSPGLDPRGEAAVGGGEGVADDPVRKAALDELHRRKIDLADYLYVLDVGGYVGESTRSEIEYATRHGVPVRYLSREPIEPE